MFSNNNLISIRQLGFLLILDIFGLGITSLPRKMAEFGGQNGWLFISIGILIAVLCLFFINQVAMMYPNDSFFEYTCKIVGKPLALIISFGFIIKILMTISFEVRIFAEILREIILSNTPFWIISMSMILLGSYMASKGFEARARISELLIWVVFIPLAFVFFIALFDIDFSNLKPLFKEFSYDEALRGGFTSLFCFSGIQYIFFVYPYVREKDKIATSTTKAVIFVGIVTILICLITIARFGKFDVVHQMWPVLEIMDTLNLPGSFVERQEALIMTFWIISIFMIVNAGMFFSSLLFKDVVKKGTHFNYICVCAVAVFILSSMPYNVSWIYNNINIFYVTLELFYMLILPFLLFVIMKFKGVKS